MSVFRSPDFTDFTMDELDVLVVGSGTAGQTAAYDLREAGLKVAVAEKSDRPGGVCALHGCQPKKWFYEVTETIARCRHLEGKGIDAVPGASWADALEQKNAFTSAVPDRTVKGFKNAGITYLPGDARFLGPDSIEVAGRVLHPRFIILATGARPMPLAMEGSEHIITSTDFLELTRLPESILFVGGGFISFEFAHFAARLGPRNIRVRIMEVGNRPLGPFDSEMVELLVEASSEEGIEVLSGVQIASIDQFSGGFRVHTRGGDLLDADLIVHGAGRVPNIEDLNLDAAGIEYSARGIAVDSGMRTSNRGVFAIGDCAATIQLARVADFEGYVASENILADLGRGERTTIDYEAVPAMLFTYPQYGMLGKTEDTLKKQNIAYRKSFGKNLRWPTYRRVGMKHAAYKILAGEDGRILGAHILSDNASGLIGLIRHAMINGIVVGDLHRQSIMSPYPTRESDLVYMLKPLVSRTS